MSADEGDLASGTDHHATIVFSLQQEQQDRQQSVLDEEREKHRRRAERFGAQYCDPGRVRRDFTLMMEARKERVRGNHGFTTGDLDVFSQEERDKRAARAARFQLPAPLAPAAALDSYKPDEELELRARRAAKFGVPYQPAETVLMDMDLYEQRREVGSSVERRPEAIYLYGVDVMSTKEVLSYFSEYGPVFVEWLDDSSCNVLFSDANSVKRAMVGKGTPLPPDVVMQPQGEQQQQEQGQEQGAAAGAAPVRYQPELPVPDNLADVANLPYVWHKGRDFVKAGTAVSLVYRMATVADVRDMNAPKRTRELWRGGDGEAGRGGRGRGRGRRGGGPQLGKRAFRRGDGEDDGAEDMEVDDGPGAAMDEDGDMPMKRQRGARGGRRVALKAMRPALQPYGGTGLLEGAQAGLLPATGHVLDYTELEDEDPAAAPAEAPARNGSHGGGGGGGGLRNGSGGGGAGWGGEGRGRGRGGRRGRGRHGGRLGAGHDGDLRETLRARRRAAAPPRRDSDDGGYGGDGAGWDGEEGGAVDDVDINGEFGAVAAAGMDE